MRGCGRSSSGWIPGLLVGSPIDGLLGRELDRRSSGGLAFRMDMERLKRCLGRSHSRVKALGSSVQAITKEGGSLRCVAGGGRIVPAGNVQAALVGHQHGVLQETGSNFRDGLGQVAGAGRGPLEATQFLDKALEPRGVLDVGVFGGGAGGLETE